MYDFVTKLASLSRMLGSVWCAICPYSCRIITGSASKAEKGPNFIKQISMKCTNVNYQKITFLESARRQLSSGMLRLFWALRPLPTNRAMFNSAMIAPTRGQWTAAFTCIMLNLFIAFMCVLERNEFHKASQMTPTWFDHATFWSGVRRATVAPRSRHLRGFIISIYSHRRYRRYLLSYTINIELTRAWPGSQPNAIDWGGGI